ncbi:hypothetical protein K525DRAFT_196724 [Schizophyllum commune Loenen D]|nr:hypothetical protein K525DRAFT_196724 [Schizophyllum commune Loenen D]
MLESAKYPVRVQTSHLLFWWARLGGLNGVPKLGHAKETRTMWVRDGSNTELSWQIPANTDPNEEANRRVRFAIDPFHPETGLRLAGGGVIDWLWGEGGMGLIDHEGTKEWKDKMEKWLFPNLPSSTTPVPGCHYAVALDLEPDGLIGLKQYYLPPRPRGAHASYEDANGIQVTMTNHQGDLEPLRPLLKELNPSLEAPFDVMRDYVNGPGESSKLKFLVVACDLVPDDKNRLKIYYFPLAQHTFKDVLRDMTLDGKLNGPIIAEAMDKLRLFYKCLFPNNSDDDLLQPFDGGVGGLSYYYELIPGHPLPCPKVYFDMSNYGENDLKTTQAVEAFFAAVGKPNAQPGWYSQSMQRAFSHRPLGKRAGIQTGVTFGLKPSGKWQITGYMSTEVFAEERGEGGPPQDQLIKEFYDIYVG